MKIIQVNEVKFTETYIEGLFIITPEIFHDNRGYFFERFNNKNFNQNINNIQFCQDNESKSSKNTLRGLHFQIPPFDQTKLVRVVKGSILDVVVDLRKNSSTFGKYYSIKLNDKNKNQLLIPKGFAHGFLTLSDECVVNYKVDNPYSKDHEKGILYSDTDLDINWGVDDDKVIISKKDLISPNFKELENYF